jgi:RND superfamily putative drug exporter
MPDVEAVLDPWSTGEVALISADRRALFVAIPFLGVRFADPDARSLPESSSSRQLADAAARRFSSGVDVDPVTVVMQTQVPPALLAEYVRELSALPGAERVTARQGVPGLTVVDVLPSGSSQGPTATALVSGVRSLLAPSPELVTGDAAHLVDYRDALRDRLPWALLVIAAATAALLFAFTGSVVVPLKAIVLNTLSLGASYGALVLVFQEGHLGALVGTEALGSLSTVTPVLVFAIAFGLSMDYEVFLLGRIAEVHRATGDNALAVEEGLRRTGRTITSAALLVVVVFAGFVAGGFSPVKQIGLGLVLAVAVDVTVVRMLLLPAAMQLMGERNWWAPGPLRRLHDRFGLSESPPEQEPLDARVLVGASAWPR